MSELMMAARPAFSSIKAVGSNTKELRSDAPNWVVSAYEEGLKSGLSHAEALGRVRQSPFFDDTWLK